MKLVLVKNHFEKQVGRKVPDNEDFFANLGVFGCQADYLVGCCWC